MTRRRMFAYAVSAILALALCFAARPLAAWLLLQPLGPLQTRAITVEARSSTHDKAADQYPASYALSGDGKLAVLAYNDNPLQFVDTRSGAEAGRLNLTLPATEEPKGQHTSLQGEMRFCNHDRYLVVPAGKFLVVIDVSTRKARAILNVSKLLFADPANAFHPYDRAIYYEVQFACAAEAPTTVLTVHDTEKIHVSILDLDTLKVTGLLPGKDSRNTVCDCAAHQPVALSPNGRLLALQLSPRGYPTTTSRPTMAILELATGKTLPAWRSRTKAKTFSKTISRAPSSPERTPCLSRRPVTTASPYSTARSSPPSFCSGALAATAQRAASPNA